MLTYTLCSVTWNITLNTKTKKTQYCYFEIKGMFESRKKWNIFITKGNYPSVTDYICPQWLLLILMRKKIAFRRCRELFWISLLPNDTTQHQKALYNRTSSNIKVSQLGVHWVLLFTLYFHCCLIQTVLRAEHLCRAEHYKLISNF